MKTFEKSITNTWLNYHKIEHIYGNMDWLFDRPTIKYAQKGINGLNIPFGTTCVLHESQNMDCKKPNALINDESVKIWFLVEYLENAKKVHKVFYSKNHVEWYVTTDRNIVDNKKHNWFDNLPKKSKILAYRHEYQNIVSDTYLMKSIYFKEDFLSTREKQILAENPNNNTDDDIEINRFSEGLKNISGNMKETIVSVYKMMLDFKISPTSTLG